ncbi:hypothetical protein M569_00388 [Genlisea aurea]|uniref:Uncharacterized protein n=1 Tax=Genlisea aurea TaxID=192259 RepID=S8DA58_9LAMI|nr:hypothetical protein M569_00388 [Genlisea aurea]
MDYLMLMFQCFDSIRHSLQLLSPFLGECFVPDNKDFVKLSFLTTNIFDKNVRARTIRATAEKEYPQRSIHKRQEIHRSLDACSWIVKSAHFLKRKSSKPLLCIELIPKSHNKPRSHENSQQIILITRYSASEDEREMCTLKYLTTLKAASLCVDISTVQQVDGISWDLARAQRLPVLPTYGSVPSVY